VTAGAAGRRRRRVGSFVAACRRPRPDPAPRRFSGAVVGLVCLLGAACGPTAAAGSSGPGSAGAGASLAPPLVAAQGGTVTLGLDQVPVTLNDHTVAGDTPAGRMIASAVWAQVFRVLPGLSPQLDTDVVDSAEVISVDPQTVVYQIDPRALWSDGVPISADDFVYAWQSQRGGSLDVDGTPDSVASTLGYRRTVTVVFKTPFADWASLFDDLLPAHVAEHVGWNTGFDHYDPTVLVSGGPWEVVAWQPGVSITLGRNPRWWAGAPALDQVVVRAVPDATVASAVAGGQVQVAYPSAFDPSVLAQVSSDPGVQSESQLGTRMVQLEFNVHQPPLDSAAVRQGIAHAVDRATLVTAVGEPENHLVWEDNDHLYPNFEPGYDDDATGYEKQDLVTADHLLQQGGLAPGALGAWTYHGAPLDLTLAWASDDPWSAAAGPVLAAQLEAAGVGVETDPVPGAQLLGTVLPTGAFDLAIVPVDGGAYESAMGAAFSTSPVVTGGAVSEDWSGFDDPHIDALFTQAVQQLAPPQAQAIYRQIDQDLWTAMPTLPLFAEPTLLVWSASLSGVTDDPGGLGPVTNMRVWARLEPAPAHTTSTSGT